MSRGSLQVARLGTGKKPDRSVAIVRMGPDANGLRARLAQAGDYAWTTSFGMLKSWPASFLQR
jgi:hypothetical protein